MKKFILTFITLIFLSSLVVYAQDGFDGKHTNKFEQLGSMLNSPNNRRTASGAPGHQYWQQQADYVINVTLDDNNQSITGTETITYTNNSPDQLGYLWVQLDQNIRAKDSDTYSTSTNSLKEELHSHELNEILGHDFDGGHKIKSVKDASGNALNYSISKTMMVIDLPNKLKKDESISFSIDWSFNINNRIKMQGRSGYEYFSKDNNYLYTIAQFFPRMAVYDDKEGWQNKQFLGAGEFALPFGNYKVSITVPADHMVGATGLLQNANDVLSQNQLDLLEKAKTSSKPVMIRTQTEAEKNEKSKSKELKTWVYHAENVRDFAFVSSRKFIWDAQGVDINGKTVMAMSYYPKEGNPLWEKYSTKVVAHTLREYSKYTFDYPYHKAISVHTAQIGMEYPMICFNFGRPNEDGSYSDELRDSMIGVIIHEVGHNFFPMIVNSDERQWAWMDEGINTFMEYLAEKAWREDFPTYGGEPKNIVAYMKSDKSAMSPIMTNPEQVQKLGPNAYGKPSTALNILRTTIMGPELFDRAFKEYAQRWMFKHPSPADFFRTMEDASAIDLDWFWKGWFYTTDHVDIAINEVKWYKLNTVDPLAISNHSKKHKKNKKNKKSNKTSSVSSEKDNIPIGDGKSYKTFYTKLSDSQKSEMDLGLNFYEVQFENLGGLVMPVILEFTYDDGSKEIKRIPAEIWRKNAQNITKVFTSKKEIALIKLDPFLETADTNTENNSWPSKNIPSKLDLYKEKDDGK